MYVEETYELLTHSYKTADLAFQLAKLLQLSDVLSKKIAIAAHLHDVGKLRLKKEVLHKQEKLSKSEWQHIQEHVELGIEMLTTFNLDPEIIVIMSQHHESFDGSGYPSGIKGDSIHVGARILKICDYYDALISDRPYRSGFLPKDALCIMERNINEFDSVIFSMFQRLIGADSMNHCQHIAI